MSEIYIPRAGWYTLSLHALSLDQQSYPEVERLRMQLAEAEALLRECDSTLAGLGHGWLRDKVNAFLNNAQRKEKRT